MEAIVLAGGLGTRLQGVIGTEQPKCMAPVNNAPFLSYLFTYLDKYCTRVMLSLGYRSKPVIEWLDGQDVGFEVDYVIEQEPLGTGGGILAAIEDAATDDVVVVNGDTMFNINLREMMAFHRKQKAEVTLALKPMENFDRYGIVHLGANNIISSFEEKKPTEKGLINGGVYIINREAFLARPLKGKFSFEKDYLEQYVKEGKFSGFESSAYFIDIGVPADYLQAQSDFKTLFS